MFDACFDKLKKDTRVRSEARIKELQDEFSYAFNTLDAPNLTMQEQLDLAAQMVKERQEAKLQKKLQRAGLNADAQLRVADVATENGISKAEAANAMLTTRHNLKNKVATVEQKYRGMVRSFQTVTRDLYRQLSDVTGIRQSQESLYHFSEALFGQGKNTEMNRAVDKLTSLQENIRQRLNAAGADIPELQGFRTVQKWSQEKIHRGFETTGKDVPKADQPRVAIESFVDNWMKWIDFDAARNADGTIRTPEEMRAFLFESGKTLYYDGANKEQIAKGMISASKAGESFKRQLHIKDAQSWREAMETYGDGSIYGQIDSFLSRSAMQIQMFETFGPNPVENIREVTNAGTASWVDKLPLIGLIRGDEHSGKHAVGRAEWMMGSVDDMRNPDGKIVKMLGGIRNLETAKLGSAVVTSLTDNATMRLIAAQNKAWGTVEFIDQLKLLDPKDPSARILIENAGLASETLSRHLYSTMRDQLDAGWTRAVGDLTLRASGLTALTDSRRGALSVSLMNGLGFSVTKYANLADVPKTSRRILESRGFTEADWKELKALPMNTAIASHVLDVTSAPTALKEKVLGWVAEEANLGVLEPGMEERYWMAGGGLKRGTPLGELATTIMQFKSFPISMAMKHMSRASGLGRAGGAGYMAALSLGLTAAGAIALQANSLLNGKDPRNMNPMEDDGWKFWVAAFVKGGSLGIYGDLLFTNESQAGQMILGPVISDVLKTGGIAFRPISQGKEGKLADPEDMAGDMIRVASGFNPASSMWWAKGAYDRVFTAQVQEALNPGYLNRQARKLRRDYGQEYFAPRDELTPERAPDLGAAWK